MPFIDKFFKEQKEIIDQKLIDLFENRAKNEKDVLLNDFVNQFKEFVSPENNKAKRLHPILLIASYAGIVNPIYLDDSIEDVRKVALSVEILHNGHLIIDDLIDEDETRRGKPTFHLQLQNDLSQLYKTVKKEENLNQFKLYGRDMSILGGNLGYLLGLDIIKTSKFPEHEKILAINEYTEALDSLIRGQIIEEYMEYHNITMSMEQYLMIAEMQRAKLFEKSCKIGAIFAKGNVHYQVKPLGEAMLKIGQASAIRDDILDVKDDIKKKKKKFVYILAVQNTDVDQSKLLNEIFHNPELSNSDVKQVEDIFAQTNALIIAEHFSKNLISQAKTHLKEIYPDLNREQKEFFEEFSDFIYLRDF